MHHMHFHLNFIAIIILSYLSNPDKHSMQSLTKFEYFDSAYQCAAVLNSRRPAQQLRCSLLDVHPLPIIIP